MISPSSSPVREGATAELPLESVSVAVASAAVLVPATGVAPENLHVPAHAGSGWQCNSCPSFIDNLARQTICTNVEECAPSETEATRFWCAACQQLCSLGTAGRLIALPFVALDHS